jgi:hypothetical protein
MMEATKCGSPEGCHEQAEKKDLNDDKIATNFKGPQGRLSESIFAVSLLPSKERGWGAHETKRCSQANYPGVRGWVDAGATALSIGTRGGE